MITGATNVAATAHDKLQFYWQESSYSVEGNYSTVGWALYLIADGYGRISSNPLRAWSVTVDGQSYSGSVNVSIGNNETKTLASGNTIIYHNADGSRAFSYSFSQDFQITFSNKWVGTVSGSGTGTLTSIPRGAKITSAPNLTDEMDSATIGISNPAGNAVSDMQICIGDLNWSELTPYQQIKDKTATSFKFDLDEANKTILRNYIGAYANSSTVRFYLRTLVGGEWLWSTIDKPVSLVNANPVLSPEAYDTGATSKVLTGDVNKVIKGFNAFYVNTGASAVKGARITSQSIVCGNKSITSTNDTCKGYLNFVESPDFVFTVVDSRGNRTTQTLKKSFVDYFPPVVNWSAKAVLAEGEETTTATAEIDFSGVFFNGSFGAKNNTLTIQYQVTKQGEESTGSWQNAEVVPNGNDFTASASVAGLDYESAYVVQARYTDETTGLVTLQEYTIKATPVFDWSGEDFNFNVPISAQGGRVYSAHILAEGSFNGTVTLADKIANYDYIEIYFTDNNGVMGGYTKIFTGDDSSQVCLSIIEASSKETTYIRRTTYSLGENTISPVTANAGYHQLTLNGVVASNNSTNFLRITRVVGYK